MTNRFTVTHFSDVTLNLLLCSYMNCSFITLMKWLLINARKDGNEMLAVYLL